jgi:Mg-chelatase subunit ChlD
MPRLDFTDITVILDRSGSMESVADDTIGGFNSFLDDQKSGHGDAVITLVQFDDQYETVYRAVPVSRARRLTRRTFEPRGSTALLDAIGRTITETGARLRDLREHEGSGQVMMVILTDGYENASRFHSIHQISDMIAHQRDVYSWEFVYIGANQDAIATASGMGMKPGSALTYDHSAAGTELAFSSVSRRIKDKRKSKLKDEEFFEPVDRALQEGEIRKSKGR